MQHVKKKKESKGGKLVGAIFGLGFFVASFFILWLNEGRINYGEVAQDSQAVSAATINTGLEGQFVAASGDLTSQEVIGDPVFLKPAEYIQLNRVVEMYAWEEHQETDDEDYTTYEYRPEWTEFPEDSSQFEYSGYDNPPMQFQSQTYTVSDAKVGAYLIDPRALTYPAAEPLDLNIEALDEELSDYEDVTNTGNFLYIGNQNITDPDIGDLRIHFTIIPQTSNVTLFGQVAGNSILPYRVEEGDSLYRLFFINRESAIQQMEQEYSTALWFTRIGGFAMMWCGMFLVLNPITILVSFFPILRQAGTWAIILITLPVAVVISSVVVSISFLAHNPIIVVVIIVSALVIVGLVAAGIYWFDKKKTQ